jgi:16S rRNA (cytidine1402-2'-O)-methyltransferase
MRENIRRPALYVVATPIGNLGDITRRALDVLRAVDLVAAEDTRVTARLLAHYEIDRPMIALHQHNERRASQRVLDALQAGQAVALTTDAGTPAVSDPGGTLVAAVRAAGIGVIPIPGPSALTAAWSVAGFPGTGFVFHGFLPSRPGERRAVLQSLAGLAYPLVFYEAPHRALETVEDLGDQLGWERAVVVGRELTKMFEEVHACTLAELQPWLAAESNRQRGEFVIIVAGAAQTAAPQSALGETALRVLLEELAPAQAARLAARLSGVSRASLYELAIKLRGKDERRERE